MIGKRFAKVGRDGIEAKVARSGGKRGETLPQEAPAEVFGPLVIERRVYGRGSSGSAAISAARRNIG